MAPGGSWASPGAVLGLSWAAPGVSWATFGVPGAALETMFGAFWNTFEGIENDLGASRWQENHLFHGKVEKVETNFSKIYF